MNRNGFFEWLGRKLVVFQNNVSIRRQLKKCTYSQTKVMTRDTHSMANALPSTGLHPETAFLTQQIALNTSKQDARTTLWVEEWNHR